MAIDTTPSTVATNALQAIPFSALIGGPLDACIQAQAQAAKTSWEFINEVGMTIDPETNEKKAITVAFEYNNNGQMTTLVVPLIILLPIPYMAIHTVTIDFMANISASSSSVQETSEDTELGVAVDATASLKVGPFSLKVSVKANYSAKSHSKAAQESKYSVEYTMQIHVEGGQADMPAGLQTVLNILQGSVASVSSSDWVTVYPTSIPFDRTDTSSLQATIKNNYGQIVEGTSVSLQFDPISGSNPFDSITVTRGDPEAEMAAMIADGRFNNSTIRAHRRLYGLQANGVDLQVKHRGETLTSTTSRRLARPRIILGNGNGDTPASGNTNSQGEISFRLKVKESVMRGTQSVSGRLLLTADVPLVDPNGKEILPPEQETQFIAFQIIPDGRQPNVDIDAPTTKLTFVTPGATNDIEVTARIPDSADPAVGLEVTAKVEMDGAGKSATSYFDAISVTDPVGSAMPTKATGATDATGKVTFTFKTQAGLLTTTEAGEITITTPGGQPIVVEFDVEIP